MDLAFLSSDQQKLVHEAEIHAQEQGMQQSSILVVTFFALSCFYFIVTTMGVTRLCQLESTSAAKPSDPNILKTLLMYIVIASSLRLLGWTICTGVYFSKSHKYIKQATYEEILGLTYGPSSSNTTYWLPVEPEEMNGLSNSPVMLVVSVFTPEVFVVISYLALCWLCFASYIDAHYESGNSLDQRDIGKMRFRVIVVFLVVLQIVLVTLYMAGVTSPQIILHELTILEFVIPIAVIFLILYYQCKYSGVPQARYTESKTRTLTACLFAWTVLRVCQSWNGLYASRQFLGMSLLLSGYSYESYLFVPFILIL